MFERIGRRAAPPRAGSRGREGVRAFNGAAAAWCAAMMLAGCGAGDAGRPQAAQGAQGAADAALARGELLSFACRPCHGLTPAEESPVGPSLHGIFGRPAASIEGFEYSAAMRESGIVWTPETLDAWLAQPETFLPGNDMDFAGFRSPEDRRALIAYLEHKTAKKGLKEGAEPIDD